MMDLIAESAGLFGPANFIIDEERTFSFNEINIKATYLARILKYKYNISRGDYTIIVSDNNLEFILLIFALWKAGSVPVPLNTKLNAKEIESILTFLSPRFIYIDPNITFHPPAYSVVIKKDVLFSEDNLLYEKIKWPFDAIIPDLFSQNETALILFTSGSSGKPKGVELTFNNLRKSFGNSNSVLNQSNKDRWLASLPFYHIGGFSIIIRALLSGASIVLSPSLTTEDLAAEIKSRKPSLISFVSTQLKRFLEAGIYPNKILRCVLLGGGYIDDGLILQALENKWPVAKSYGSTETSSLITFLSCKIEKDKISSAGKPLNNNQIFIVDEKKNILPPNSKGEIAVKGESCSVRYFNNPEETNNKFLDGIYYTGDHGFIDEDGYLFVEARRDDLIVTGGENVNPLEIEKVIKEFPGIINVSVFGEEDKEWGHIISAAVKIDPVKDFSTEMLKEYLLTKISSFKIPKKFYVVDEFPLSPLGKMLKDKLMEIIRKQ
jgi:O-succinylbenzoic acid--CoA ligase